MRFFILRRFVPLVSFVAAAMSACDMPPAEEPLPTAVVVATPPAANFHTNVWVGGGAAPAQQPSVGTASVAATQPAPAPAPRVEVSNGVRVTTFQRRQLLGHYSTLDGKTGFVLDRTVDPPRLRFDGDPYVKNLDVRPSLHCCVEYAAGGLWMRVDKDTGAVVEFTGPLQTDRSVRVIRDADAEPLPTP